MLRALLVSLVISSVSFASGCDQYLTPPRNFKEWEKRAAAIVPEEVPAARVDLPVLFIGAGPRGLAAMSAVKDRQISFEGTELASGVGGLWNPSNPESPAYDDLKMNSSIATSSLGDPFPAGSPDYLSRAQALSYLQGFARNHGLVTPDGKGPIHFNTRVVRTGPCTEGTWCAVLESQDVPTSRQFRSVVVGSGRHSKSSGKTPGVLLEQAIGNGIQAIHASEFRTATPFTGQRVLIQGVGNTGAEIAARVSQVAKYTAISVRSAPWVAPDYVRIPFVLRQPADQFAQTPFPVPHFLETIIFRAIIRTHVGTHQSIGLGTPDHDILQRLPIVERGIVQSIREGRLTVRPDINSIEDGNVKFADGSAEAFDTVIFATGYDLKLPFLPEPYRYGEETELPFWVFHPTDPNLIYMHEVVVAQGGWPIFAAQAKVVAAYLAAQQRNSLNYRRFLAMRRFPNPNFKARVFAKAPADHVDAKTYVKWLEQLANWLDKN